MLIFGYRLNLWQCIETGCLDLKCFYYLGLRLLLGYGNYDTIDGSLYSSAHVLIENTLVQHKMANNSRMVLCYQNRVSKGTNQCYGLHSSASSSVHNASITVLGLLEKKRKKKN